jgi:hypothetical protein
VLCTAVDPQKIKQAICSRYFIRFIQTYSFTQKAGNRRLLVTAKLTLVRIVDIKIAEPPGTLCKVDRQTKNSEILRPERLSVQSKM